MAKTFKHCQGHSFQPCPFSTLTLFPSISAAYFLLTLCSSPASSHPATVVGTMAQATSPSLSLQDGGPPHDHRSASRMKSDSDVPIDPSIAQQTSPAYPPPYPSPFNGPHPGPHDMSNYNPHQPPPGMYRHHQPPDWPPQFPGQPVQYSGSSASASPATAVPRTVNQVCATRSLTHSLTHSLSLSHSPSVSVSVCVPSGDSGGSGDASHS